MALDKYVVDAIFEASVRKTDFSVGGRWGRHLTYLTYEASVSYYFRF